jgi:uncharacterized protein
MGGRSVARLHREALHRLSRHSHDNRPMTLPKHNEPEPIGDAEIARLHELLCGVPEPLQPLDPSSLDGFLCGVVLQPKAVPQTKWMPCITDIEARPLPPGFDASALMSLVRRRHDQLRHAIGTRQWFDPWVFESDASAEVSDSVLPWIAGFASAMERFDNLLQHDDPALLEPLALLFMHFDPEDLEGADALRSLIDTIEPPAGLAEAVEDLVRSVMLIADVIAPVASAAKPARRPQRGRR